jgi:hypothetical protein
VSSWVFGLSSWIVLDGNYPDFERGQIAEFAVEFDAHDLESTAPAIASAQLVKDSDYRITGEVVFAGAKAWVIDCGILIYDEGSPPSGIDCGDWVAATAFLGVDPFMYFERLHRLADMQPIIYTWRIDRIRRQMAPFIEVRPRYFERDVSRWGYEDVDATDAWEDDGGHAEYLLVCAKTDEPPGRRSTTAVYP